MQNAQTTGLASLLAALALMVAGCSETKKGDEHKTHNGNGHARKNFKHGGWWCAEHGIPEAECSMCSPKVAREFKKKGDWCDKHNRAMSQCFICNPEQKEVYAAKYRAKYGKEPPPIEEE
ncbi:MAG: hypothetical protein KatS3mg105_0750 [Gemmatales bacterium]|nr:MAG: hypothetical protein KatS3mg105_0750 [Gemmatales bacterium]